MLKMCLLTTRLRMRLLMCLSTVLPFQPKYRQVNPIFFNYQKIYLQDQSGQKINNLSLKTATLLVWYQCNPLTASCIATGVATQRKTPRENYAQSMVQFAQRSVPLHSDSSLVFTKPPQDPMTHNTGRNVWRAKPYGWAGRTRTHLIMRTTNLVNQRLNGQEQHISKAYAEDQRLPSQKKEKMSTLGSSADNRQARRQIEDEACDVPGPVAKKYDALQFGLQACGKYVYQIQRGHPQPWFVELQCDH